MPPALSRSGIRVSASSARRGSHRHRRRRCRGRPRSGTSSRPTASQGIYVAGAQTTTSPATTSARTRRAPPASAAQVFGLRIDGYGNNNHIGLDPADSSLYPAHKRNRDLGQYLRGCRRSMAARTRSPATTSVWTPPAPGASPAPRPHPDWRPGKPDRDRQRWRQRRSRAEHHLGEPGGGIEINGGNDNVVAGNYIGTDPTGTTIANLGNTGNNSSGIVFNYAGTGNTIGGSSAAARNIIAGSAYGIRFYAHGDPGNVVSGNVVAGNYIGTDVTGRVALGNLLGVDLLDAEPST